MPRQIPVVLIVLFLSVHCFQVFAQDPNFHIYICFGQSNMEGVGNIENQDRAVDSRFQVFEALDCANLGRSYGKWYTAVPPLARCNTKLGPADYFGRTMVANLPSNIKVGVVNVAIAGCDIALFGKTGYSGYDTYNVIPSKYGGSAYAWLLEVAKLAQKDGVIKGILMHQGETNSGQSDWPNKVKAVYNNLLQDLKLDASKTPLLVGEVLRTDQNGLCGGHNSVIAKVPGVIPNAYVISASGLGGQSDRLHFTSASYRTLGQRYAEQMLKLLPSTVTGAEEETDMNNVTVYPNPSHKEFSMYFDRLSNYELIDHTGNLILHEQAEGNVRFGESLSPGLYMLKVIQNDNIKIIKIVKE